jgi:hypothetical protein
VPRSAEIFVITHPVGELLPGVALIAQKHLIVIYNPRLCSSLFA